jgi:hypothetical protein
MKFSEAGDVKKLNLPKEQSAVVERRYSTLTVIDKPSLKQRPRSTQRCRAEEYAAFLLVAVLWQLKIASVPRRTAPLDARRPRCMISTCCCVREPVSGRGQRIPPSSLSDRPVWQIYSPDGPSSFLELPDVPDCGGFCGTLWRAGSLKKHLTCGKPGRTPIDCLLDNAAGARVGFHPCLRQVAYRTHLAATFADADAVFVIDSTTFPKQDQHSLGVQRQYCGRSAKG